MRIIGTIVLLLLSILIVIGSLELKAWSDDLALNDAQGFMKYKKTQLDKSSWENFFGHKLEIDEVSTNIIDVSIERILPGNVSSIIKKFEQLKYIHLYNLELISERKEQVFKISAILTLP